MKFVPLDEVGEDSSALTFVPLEAEKDDSFFSLDRAKEAALNVARLMPGMGDLGRDDPARVEAPRRGITDTARENLPTIDKSLQLSPSKGPQYRSVLEDAAPIEDVPRASNAPLRPEVRRALESSWDAGSEQQRALLENTAGVTGQVARERGAVFDRADKSAMATPTGKATDSRVEARRAELVRKGEHPEFARRAAYEGAAKGVNPGDEIRALDGTVQESTMDFETRKLFDQNQEVNGLNNSLVRGVAKGGLGATKALAGYGQFMSEVYGLDNAARKTADYGDELRKKEDAIGDGGGGLRGNFEGTVASIAQQLPLWLTGSQPIALAGMALQSFGQEYSDGRSKGQTTVQAAERASMFAAFEVIGEKFGLKGNMDSLKKLLDGQTNAAAMGFLSNMLKREIPGELLTTTGQFGVDKFGADGVALNPNATAGDYFAQVKDTIFQTVMQGGLMSGGSKVAGSAANAVSGWRQSRIDQDPSAALAQALESGQFAPGSVGASVADALRTQPGTSNAISPAATTMGAPISAPQVDAKAVVESARDAAMADIGKAQSVDEAVASANMATNLAGRAVQIDGERLLNETLQAAGLADALAPAGVAQQPTAETVGAAQAAPLAGGQSTVTAATSPNYGVPNAVAPSRVVWTGRRGDGYAAPEDATRALNERQRLRPAYDWTVQQNPEGRYVLEGMPKGQNGAAQATSMPGNTMAAQMAQNAPEAAYGGGDVSVRGRPYQGDLRQQPADSGVDVDAAAAVQELAVAAGSPGGFHAVSREVALRELDAGEQRQRSMEARGLSAARSPAVPAEVLGDIENFVEAAQASFGTRPVMMSGPKDVFGVQYRGRTFFNISAIANGDRKGNLVQAIALQTIGHETTHDLEKSANPQDRADHALLRQAVLGNAKDGVVAQRVTREQKDLKRLPGESDAQYAARSQRYGEKEVVADVSGNFWTDPKFWERLYDLDKAAMRRIAYKFMEKATKLLKTVKGSRLDNETFINNIEQVREVAAQVWARKAQRGDSLFDGRDNTVSKSQSDDMLPGVNVEVAPDPRNAEAKEKWGKLTEIDKLGITKEVMDKLATKVFDKMGLSGWGVEYTSGMFEGGINPSAILRAPQSTDAQTLGEVMRVFGYLLDQKGMVAFDESNTTSDSQAGFVKVVLPKGLSTDRIDAIRKEIASRVPQAEGDTVRDGAIVYGNFSALNSKIETLTDEQFKTAIEDAIRAIDSNEIFDVAGPFVFHSEYDQAYWSEDTYDPKGREAYLEKTRYGSSEQQEAPPGRDGVRRWGRDSVFRPWLEALARSTDTRVTQLVGDRQQRSSYVTTPDGRADQPRSEQPAQPGGRDRAGRPDAVRSGVAGVDSAGAGGEVRGAVHYGRVGQLSSLSGAMNGTGIRGAENDRVAQSADQRTRQRVYFYLPVAGGIPQPESGLGQHVYKADLSNLYDTASQKMRLPADGNAMESAILDAGYSGFFNEAQGTVVMFGSVPVRYEGTSDKFNKVQRQPKVTKPKSVTRTEGDTLVRRPEGSEVMEIIAARKAGLEMAAPSFKMQFGEARVLASEAPVADAVFDSVGAKFKFGEPAYSRDFDELGAFNIDAELDSLDDAMTEKDMGAIQAELMAEFEAEFGAMASKPKAGAPSKDAIAKAGLNAEDAFDFAGALKESGQGLAYDVPDFADDLVLRVSLGSDVNAPRATVELADGVAVFVNARTASKGAVEKLIARQVAGAQLRKDKHDIASAYRKNTILNLAANWKAVARKAGVFKFGEGSKADGFAEIAKSMGAFKGYRVEVTKNYGGFNVEFARESDGRGFSAEVTEHQSVRCCTMGLDGSGGLGTEFYAVMGRYAQNNGKRFLADEYLSGINSYRRTEQALSFALKSGDTGVLLPGPQNRVYGYNTQPKTQEEHDKNLARLALAGLRNVQELYPDVRRLRYDPATDRFSDSQGDAEDKVAKALKGKDARAFGLGRSTVARAVITSQIIKGEAIKADKFESPIAYSLADVGLDESMAEGWGDDAGGVQPGLRRFMAGSKIVNEDGKPIVMYHGTAQDIHAFRGKQAGAIFLSYSPRFAGDFAALSGQWMQDHWTQVLTPEQQEQAKKMAAAAVMADKSVKMAERKAMKQSIMDGKPEGMAKDAMNEAVRDMMPSGENILPVFVRATAPFDFRDKAMVDDVVGFLFDKNMAGENDKVRIRLVSEKGDRANMNARTMRELISGGAWDVIESPEVQEVIRELGHDGFFVKEDGQINLAVYEPGQVKSVFNRGTFDPLDERLSYSRRAGPKEFNYRDNYLVPELDGAFDDDSGNIAVMPALIFAKDGIRREFKSMPVRIKIGDHQRVQTGNAVKQQGLQHRIENQRKDAAYRGYITPALEGDVTEPTAAEVERAARDITLGVLDSKTAYADGSPAKIYLHSPSLNRQTVLERQRDAKGKDFWSVITVSPSDRNQMMRRYKAPTSVVGVSLNGDRTQQANDTLLGILKKLREPGKPPVTSESYILDEDGLLFHQDPARKSTNKADAPKAVKQLPRDENGRIILNRRKAQADGGVSMSRADIDGLGMYSALARGVSDMKASAAPVVGWKELIKGMVNKGQAKQDEVEWSGLNDWLDTRQGRVTKDEVLEYLRGNGVQVQEVVLGNPNGFTQDMQERLDDLEYRIASLTDEEESERQRLISTENAASDARGDTNQTKYGSYTLPGGENYREVLLTLPAKTTPKPDMLYASGEDIRAKASTLVDAGFSADGVEFAAKFTDDGGSVRGGLEIQDRLIARGYGYTPGQKEAGQILRALLSGQQKRISAAEAESAKNNYRSSHFDQPNILAHIRVNDRVDADGAKVLFVEEVQSDWGQDGKKKGFAEKEWWVQLSNGDKEYYKNEQEANRIARENNTEAHPVTYAAGKVPTAPFVQKTEGWLNLALKRVIAMAVQGGYDKVAFVTGQQSAERYDLSKQIESMEITRLGDGAKYHVHAKKNNGEKAIDKAFPKDELPDVIGKDLADKAIAETSGAKDYVQYSGLDLKVGGEGMIAFYDKIVPNAVKALVKKLGGGQMEMVSTGESNDGKFAILKPDGTFHSGIAGVALFPSRASAQAAANKLNRSQGSGHKPAPAPMQGGEQPGFDITPAMREKVGEGLPSFSRANGGFDLPEETRTQKARRKMQDYFLRAQVVQRAIAGQGGVVDEQTDFYRAEELSHGRTASLMKDFADHQVQPLMEKAVKLGIELDELSLYAYAMHAKERNTYIASIDSKLQDGGSGMTNDEADSILQMVDLSGDKAKFDELHTDLMTITRGNRLAMLADGLITQQEFEALEGAYEYYVPLRGFEKLDEDGKPAPARSAGKGFNIRGVETIRAKGRVSRAGQIIENIIHDHQRTITRGERNHVAKVFLNFVLKNPDPDLWEIDATTTRKSIDRKTGRIARDTAIEKGEDTISVKLQGQEVYIRIKDEMLLRALRKSHADETGQLTSDLMKSVGLYSALLRNTLTRYNPEFAVVNAMRDVGFGATAVLDELGEKGVAKYMAHYAGAMAVSARNESKKLDASSEWDRWFNEFKAAGGTTSGFYAKGLDEIGSDIRDMMIEAGAAPKDWSEKVRFNKATRAAKGALRVLEWAGSVSENAARVAAYRTAREMGKTPSQAASIAKNLTTNFDRKGEYGQLTNALYLFYNAGIQGTHRTAKMLKNPRVWGYMGSVTAAMVALAFHNAGEDDPEDGMAYWDKIPAHVKERNIIIMLPPGAQVEGAKEVGTKGRYVTIPVQYGLNIFHVMGYQIADVLRNQQDPVRGVNWKKAIINMASATAGSFNPFGGSVDLTNGSSVIQAVLPTVFDFPYQLVSGTNAFGRDVAPFKSPFDAKPDSQNSNVRQAGGPAERVAQWLNDVTGGSDYEAGAVDVSAGTLENVVRGLTGGTGAFVYDVIALGGKWAEQVGGGDPDLFVRDMPIVRRLTGETAGDVDQGLFYERRKAIQEARAIEKAANEAGAEIADKEKIALSSLNGDAGKTTRWLAEVRREMKDVQRDESLTPQERRLKLRELRAERDRLTASFNAAFMEVMREELAPSLADE